MKEIKGRINRRTYFVGSAISVATAGVLTVFLLAPFALLELVITSWNSDGILRIVEKAFLLIPAGYFLLLTVLLTARRAQDFGSRGLYWLVALFGIFAINHFLELKILTLVLILMIGILCLKPGTPKRNKYGGKPADKLNLQDVYRL